MDTVSPLRTVQTRREFGDTWLAHPTRGLSDNDK